MIDFHLVYREGAPSPYLDEAIDSLEGRSLFVSPDHGGYIQGRYDGFQKGSAPYVSFIDDDDEATNIEALQQFLADTGADAVYTDSMLVDKDSKPIQPFYPEGTVHTNEAIRKGRTMVHQLVVVKREIVMRAFPEAQAVTELLGLQRIFDQALYQEIARITEWTHFPQVCYHWRHWDSDKQAHSRIVGGQRHKLTQHYTRS